MASLSQSLIFDPAGTRIWVAGHRGMIGSALVRRLAQEKCEILTTTRHDLDLRDQAAVFAWLDENRPDAVIVAAAKVGGIWANASYPADFLYENLAIEANIVHGAHRADVDRLLFLGSSCIYPKLAEQPMREEALLTGPLEPTNEAYAIAKIAGLKLAESYRTQYGRSYISAMPTNLYGPGDRFDLENGHVLAALMHRSHLAKIAKKQTLTLWGTGTPLREFLHADDCADALVFLLKHYDGLQHVNVGSGHEISILELANRIIATVGFDGEIDHDRSKPDGTPRKLMDGSKLQSMGWQPSIGLDEGLRQTYAWYLENVAHREQTYA